MRVAGRDDPELAAGLAEAARRDLEDGRIDVAELDRVARVIRRLRASADLGPERADALDVLGRLTVDLDPARAAPLGGEAGRLPGLRRLVKRVARVAVRARTAAAFERQRDLNLAMRGMADGLLARGGDAREP